MNQVLIVSLEKEVNGSTYRLCLPMGAQWSEALAVVKEFHDACIALSEESQRKYEESLAAQKEDSEKKEGE